MNVLEKLASSLGRRDEVPNQELAKNIVSTKNKKAIHELVENLRNKNKDISGDCIKVLYEIGASKPELIGAYTKEFVALLESKNNRLQWGAMIALDAIASEDPKSVYHALPKIIAAADKGSVITNDHCVGILVKLCAVKEYTKDSFSLLNERLLKSATNQLAMYAEKALPIISDKNKNVFIKTLKSRLGDIEKDTQRVRIEKVMKKLGG